MSSCTLRIVDLASSVADFIHAVNSLTVSSPEGAWLGSKPIRGIRLVSSRNGGCCVAEWIWLLCWNSAIGRRSYQSFCRSLTNKRRNWSSSWLTHSVCPFVWGCQAVEEDSRTPSSLYSSLVLRIGVRDRRQHVSGGRGASRHGEERVWLLLPL